MKWTTEQKEQLLRLVEEMKPGQTGPCAVIGAAFERSQSYATKIVLQIAPQLIEPRAPGASKPTSGLRGFLLKPVGDRCNLACKYCYEDIRRAETESDLGRMPVDTRRRILDNLIPHVQAPFSIFLHGGEPMLAGKEWFKGFIDDVRERNPSIELGLQTNATLIDDEWASIFRENGIKVGISMDGSPAQHDAMRIDHRGDGSSHAVMKGIEALQSAGVSFGVISVITEPIGRQPKAAQRLFDHFIQQGIYSFDCHPSFTFSDPGRLFNLTAKSYRDFMVELFEVWLQHGDPQIAIRSIEFFFQGMTGLYAEACHKAGKCMTILGCEPDGSVSPCTRTFDKSFCFGNLSQQTLVEIMCSDAFHRFQSLETSGQRSHSDCQWSGLCGNGGCPHERMSDGVQAVDGRHVYCTCETYPSHGYPGMFRSMIERIELALADRCAQ